ncbi:MAG: S8 family serine peptidase [bacterium]
MKGIVSYLIFFIIGFISAFSNEYLNEQCNKTADVEGRAVYHKDRVYIKFKRGVKINSFSQQSSVNSRQSHVYIKSFGNSSVDKILKNYPIEKIEPAFKQRDELPKKVKERVQNISRTEPDLSRIYSVKLTSGVHSIKLIKELNQNPDIEYAELVPCDYPLEVPNDSMYAQCQHLPQIMAEQAWDVFKGEQSDSTILIGICDTGTNWNHIDLTDNLWQNLAEDADNDGTVLEWVDSLKKYILDPGDLNGIDDDENGYIDDLIGWDFVEDYDSDTQGNDPQDFNNHGTHVAGISAGVTNNNIGIASVSWNVKFVPTSHSSPSFNNILRGFEGIVYLAELGCDVINCSWGGGGYSRANAEAVEYADALGAIVIAAAGNDNSPAPFYPSSYPHLVSVASVSSKDIRANYSNYGNFVDICAPGGQTNVDGGIMSCIRNGGYARFQGTSMASPVAAGVFGLVKAKFPDWSNEHIKRQVIGTADNIDSLNPNYINMLGNGRINAFRALSETDVNIPKILKLDLMHVQADDSTDDSNFNKALEPGENVRIGFIIRNYAILTGSESTKLTISCEDDDIEIIQNTFLTNFTADGTTETPLIFEIKISDTATSKFVDFTITSESDDAEIVMGNVMDFQLPINAGGILVWEGRSNGWGYSGKFISDFLSSQGVENIYTNTFPVSIVGYDAVLLSFGSIGSGMGSTPLNDWMAEDISDYLKSGGKLYLEGMDVLGFDQVLNKDFLSLVGIDSSSDGSDMAHSIDTLFGQQETICDGLIYFKSNITGYQSIDEIFPNENGKVALFEPAYGNTAIQNIGKYEQKTFVTVYPVAHLIDRTHPNSRYELLKRIMDFLELPMDYTIPRFSYNPKTGHAPLTVNYNDVSYTSKAILSWDWDFKGDGEKQTIDVKNTNFIFEEPGDFVTNMTVHNEKGLFETSNPVFVFDGESAAFFENNTLGQIADTNLNIRDDFTIEAWIMPSNISTSVWQVLMDKIHVSFDINNTRSLRLYTYHDDRSVTDFTTAPESVTFSTWQHVAVTFDGDSTFQVYINGNQQNINYSKGPGKGKVRDNLNAPLTIGKSYQWANGFEGRIDEFRFWSKPRTQQEIQSAMFRKLSGNEDSLMLYWKFNEGAGDTAKDFSPNNRTCTLNSDWRQGIHESHIIFHPQSNLICEGRSYIINTDVISGGTPLTFQWIKNGTVVIPNANESKYYIDEMSESDVGFYQLAITDNNTWEREFSDTAFIDIESLPVIIEQPPSLVQLNIGETLHLDINAESKSNLSYEWFKNDEPLDYYQAEYFKENVSIEDTGHYNCVIMNKCGFVESDYSNVTIVMDIDNKTESDFNFNISPNPVNDNSIVTVHSPKQGEIKIIINDILGNKIYCKNKILNSKGINSFRIFQEFDFYSNGLYFITIDFGNSRLTKPIIYSK